MISGQLPGAQKMAKNQLAWKLSLILWNSKETSRALKSETKNEKKYIVRQWWLAKVPSPPPPPSLFDQLTSLPHSANLLILLLYLHCRFPVLSVQCGSSESDESDSSESSINGKNFDGVNGMLRALPGSEGAAAHWWPWKTRVFTASLGLSHSTRNWLL